MNMSAIAGRGSICILLLGLTAAPALAQASAQDSASVSAEGASALVTMSSSKATSDAENLPDSPGATRARVQSSDLQQIALMEQTDVPELPPPTQASQSPAAQQSTTTPVGTAAAPSLPTTGVAASEPAGVAIAPEKQRRVRTIVIRVGAIIAAGVAVGTVVALSEGTSSKPPGAH